MALRKTTLAFFLAICGALVLWTVVRQGSAERKDVSLTRVLAGRGDAEAQYHLGSLYYYGKNVRQSYTEAARSYRRSAGQSSSKAQYALGYCYGHGQGVIRDDTEAALWVRKAADQGYA